MSTPKTLIDRMRRARIQAKMSQDEAARLIHVARRTWTRWEAGQVPVRQGLGEYFLSLVGEPDVEPAPKPKRKKTQKKQPAA